MIAIFDVVSAMRGLYGERFKLVRPARLWTCRFSSTLGQRLLQFAANKLTSCLHMDPIGDFCKPGSFNTGCKYQQRLHPETENAVVGFLHWLALEFEYNPKGELVEAP